MSGKFCGGKAFCFIHAVGGPGLVTFWDERKDSAGAPWTPVWDSDEGWSQKASPSGKSSILSNFPSSPYQKPWFPKSQCCQAFLPFWVSLGGRSSMSTFSWMSALLCDQIHSAASVNILLFLVICHREEVPIPGARGDQLSTRTEG